MISSRAASKEAGCDDEQKDQRQEGAGCGAVPGEGEKAERGYIDGIHSNSAENNKHIAANLVAATRDSSGSFKIALPVTLIDSAGQVWSMKYVTNTRDNLHSGRLVEGWETFCGANGLRIGDTIEFTRVEALEQEPGRHGMELVARVVVLKKHCRNR